MLDWHFVASHTKYIYSPVLCFIYTQTEMNMDLCTLVVYKRRYYTHTNEEIYTHFVAEHIPVIWLIYIALRVV